MEIDQLEAFVAIVRAGGFVRAASQLHLSQPAISRRIGLLEHQLGAPLFERLGRSTRLSAAGQAFLPHAEAVLAAVRDGTEAVATVRGKPEGSVTLALVGTLASTSLTRVLGAFRRRHPKVDLRIRTALSHEVSALVLRGEAALGLRYDADPRRELVCERVHEDELVPVCAPSHPGARRRVRPRDLAGQRWLAFPPRPGESEEPFASAIRRQLAACGLASADVLPVDSLTAQKRMVEAGFGLALLPASSIEEERRSKSLAVLRIADLRARIPVILIRRRAAFLSAAVRALSDALSAWS